MQRLAYLILVCLVLVAAACQARPAATAGSTALPATATPTMPATTTAMATPTATPTRLTPATPAATASPAPTATPPDLGYLDVLLHQELADFDGVSSYTIADLKTGRRITHNPDVAISGMSLVKIAILVETYRALDEAPTALETRMISETAVLSGNYTANLLLERIAGQPDPFLGAMTLTQSMHRLGLSNTFIAVPYDHVPEGAYLPTYLTPANSRADITTIPDPYMQTTTGDLAELLTMIYRCAAGEGGMLLERYPQQITPAECQAILEIMQQNRIGSLVEDGVPDGVPIAHKHGWIGDTHGDAAIVFSPGGAYVFVIALHHPGWLEWGVSAPLIGRLSRLVYRHFNDAAAYPPAVLAQPPAITPQPTATATPNLPMALVAHTGGAGLTLRSEPGGSEVTVLPEGTALYLLETGPSNANGTVWRHVRTPGGLEGWVGADYLVLQP
jgi:beta-lactamase class A